MRDGAFAPRAIYRSAAGETRARRRHPRDLPRARMMKFLFCSLDSPGFLYPAIGIAKILQNRGHEVAFVTNIQHAGLLSGYGFERFARGPKDGQSFQVAQWGQEFSIAIQVKHIDHALESFHADALVGQSLTLGPLLVSERRKLPVGLIGFCTYLWPPSDDTACNRRSPQIEELRAWRHEGMLQTLDKARKLFHLPSRKAGLRDTPLLGDLFLLQSVPDLEPAWEELPGKIHLVGSCLWEPEGHDPELERWLSDPAGAGAPLIYVQHGRSFHIPSFWNRLVDALAGSEYRVAASVGRLDGEIGDLPDNFFVRPHIPQGRVLQSARVLVASANTTASLGALTAGVPSLLIPAGGEQPDVAELWGSAGVARTLSTDEATPDRICSEVTRLLADPLYRQRARHLASSFARMDGRALAADLLEALARHRLLELTA